MSPLSTTMCYCLTILHVHVCWRQLTEQLTRVQHHGCLLAVLHVTYQDLEVQVVPYKNTGRVSGYDE